MQQTRVIDLGVGIDTFKVKACKRGCGSDAIKAVAVI